MLLVFAILFFIGFASSVSALSDPLWIDGSITGPVTEDTFDANIYWVFNFTITNTNRTGLVTVGNEIQVLCRKDIENAAFVVGGFYNLTGRVVDLQVDEKPYGSFVVSEVNVEEYNDWLAIARDVIEALSGIVKLIGNALAEIIFIATGYVVPEVVMTLAIVGVAAFFVVKNLKTLSITLIIVVIFLLVSGGANLIRMAFFA